MKGGIWDTPRADLLGRSGTHQGWNYWEDLGQNLKRQMNGARQGQIYGEIYCCIYGQICG